jgi:hypothetical protein
MTFFNIDLVMVKKLNFCGHFEQSRHFKTKPNSTFLKTRSYSPYTVIFFWAKLVRNGRIPAVKFRPKKFGRNFADLGEFPPNQQIFGSTLDEIRPN